MTVKSHGEAVAIAKALSRYNQEAANRYMELFPRRNAIEAAAKEASLSGGEP